MSAIIEDTASLAEKKLLKKRENNRKKKARQKAKKKQQQEQDLKIKEEFNNSKTAILNKSIRKDAGKGRGKGLFAKCIIQPGEIIVRARPALSAIFDPYSSSICSYCFKPASAAGTVQVNVTLRKQNGKVGLFIDEKKIQGVLQAVINGCAPDTELTKSINSLSGVMPGDVIESIDGKELQSGEGALQRCLEVLQNAGGTKECLFPVTVRRVALQPCISCSRAAICIDCDKAGFGAWHSSYECPAFKQLPIAMTKGESTAIRMMLRYKAIATKGDWTTCIDATPPGNKEPLVMVHTLQANTDVVPPKQRQILSKMTGVPEKVVSLLIGQIRGNAASIERGGKKVGCALSAHMGYSNHDCTPNAEAVVNMEGFVTLRALTNINADEEICISYIDVNQHVEQRLNILSSHYEFKCTCERCTVEKKNWLRAKAKNRGDQYLMNHSKVGKIKKNRLKFY